MNIKSSKTLVSEALNEIKTISADEAFTMITEEKCNLIDIRDIRELKKTGKIKGAKHIPRGMLEFWLDPESPYYKKDITPDKTKVLYCASNWRSALAALTIQEMGFNNVSHIKGGFQAMVDGGFETEIID